MKNITKILVPTDFSENAMNAFRYAIWFADQYEADIHLLHVVYPTAEPLDFPSLAAQMAQKQIETAEEVVKSFTERGLAQVHTTYGPRYIPKITSEVLMGTAEARIKEIAVDKNIDLVIMGTKGEHNNLQNTFGSITTGTMNQAPCPILVVPEKAIQRKIKTIGYATDLRPSDPYHIWEIGRLLAPFAAILRVVHIEKRPDEERPLNMKNLQDFFASNVPSLQVNFHNIATKNVEEELANFEETWEVDLMVMAKPNRGFFQRLFHRSVTKKFALHTDVPLLILRA